VSAGLNIYSQTKCDHATDINGTEHKEDLVAQLVNDVRCDFWYDKVFEDTFSAEAMRRW